MVAVLLTLSRFAAGLPLATVRVGAFSSWAMAAFCACMLLCSTATVWRWRFRLCAMVGLACAVLLAGVLRGDFLPRYVQLDVGQALSGVLHTGGKTYVYDCGDANSDLTEYLLYTGSAVEGLFLSHPHADHVRGLDELLDAGIPVRTVYVPAQATALGADSGYEELLLKAAWKGSQMVELSAGDRLLLSGATVDVVAPSAEVTRGRDANDRSLVLLVTVGAYKLLLTGDADGAAEPLGIDCDVLQVAHHGSANAAREPFLRDATPDIALISYGRNTYGHPSQATIERLNNAGAQVYATQESGALTIFFGNNIRVEAFCP